MFFQVEEVAKEPFLHSTKNRKYQGMSFWRKVNLPNNACPKFDGNIKQGRMVHATGIIPEE